MTYVEQAKDEQAGIDQLLAAADAEVAQLNKDVAAAQAQTQKVQAEYDAYKAAHPDTPTTPPVPPKPVVKTLVGSSLGTGDFEAFATRCGGLEVTRTYSPPNKMPTSIKAVGGAAATSLGKRHIVHSFKGRGTGNIDVACQSLVDNKDDAWLNPFMDSKPPTQGLSLIWRHEPDEETPTIALWKKAQIKFRALVDAANNRGRAKYPNWQDIQFGANLMSWSVQKVPDRIKDFYPGPGVWDFISWDGYAQSPEPASATWAGCKAWNDTKGSGEPFAIGETGMRDAAANGAACEKWIKDVMDYAKSVGAPWACYWNTDMGVANKNYLLSPAQEKVLGAQT